MLLEQARLLQEHGKKLLSEGKPPKLAIECFAEARDILANYNHNTLQVYLQYAAYLFEPPTYKDYAAFCARNSSRAISEHDFLSIVEDANPSTLDLLE